MTKVLANPYNKLQVVLKILCLLVLLSGTTLTSHGELDTIITVHIGSRELLGLGQVFAAARRTPDGTDGGQHGKIQHLPSD